MSVPVHVVQDAPFVGPVLIKNAAGNTFLLDPRQVCLKFVCYQQIYDCKVLQMPHPNSTFHLTVQHFRRYS